MTLKGILAKLLAVASCAIFIISPANWVVDDPRLLLGDLEIIHNVLKAQYAPREWKKEHANIDLEEMTHTAKRCLLLRPPPSLKSYQQYLKNFFINLKDYHAGILFYSTEQASLPFYIKGAEGRFFVAWVKHSAPENFFKCGDEILFVNHRPISDAIAELRCEMYGHNHTPTDQALAETFFSFRAGALGLEVPSGEIVVTGKRQGSEELEDIVLEWNYKPEEIEEPSSKMRLGTCLMPYSKSDKSAPATLFHKKMSFSQDEVVQQYLLEATGNPHLINSRNGFLPPLGDIIWQTEEEDVFYAYLFRHTDEKLYGFIRIPHYMMKDEEALEFRALIDLFEASSEALIIDQSNNDGGFAFFGYGLLSMLTDYPLSVPLHRQAINQSDIYRARSFLSILEPIKNEWTARKIMGETFMGYPVSYKLVQNMRNWCLFIIDEWKDGRKLTQPGALLGIDTIHPHPKTNYTKPILMYINELDISCGDFIPAILQDNHRARIVGARTAGAGGYIKEVSYPNLSGISAFYYTGSIAERLDHTPIENRGVTPDAHYTVTANDLQYSFPELKQFLLYNLEKIVEQSDGQRE